jgi:hypothetical protein
MVCGAIFPRVVGKRNLGRFCTKKCSGAQRTAISLAKRQPREIRRCVCGTPLLTSRYSYCSLGCRPSRYKQRARRSYHCEQCSVSISRQQHHGRDRDDARAATRHPGHNEATGRPAGSGQSARAPGCPGSGNEPAGARGISFLERAHRPGPAARSRSLRPMPCRPWSHACYRSPVSATICW